MLINQFVTRGAHSVHIPIISWLPHNCGNEIATHVLQLCTNSWNDQPRQIINYFEPLPATRFISWLLLPIIKHHLSHHKESWYWPRYSPFIFIILSSINQWLVKPFFLISRLTTIWTNKIISHASTLTIWGFFKIGNPEKKMMVHMRDWMAHIGWLGETPIVRNQNKVLYNKCLSQNHIRK